jgi:hypothetical protein
MGRKYMAETYVRSNTYNISSKNAKTLFNGSALSSGLWELPNLNFTDPNLRTVYFSIQHAEIPNTFYIINSSNDRLVIDDGTQHIVVCPHGNYNVTTFITAITPLMPAGYTWTYNQVIAKLTLTKSSGAFTLLSSQSTIRDIIGLGNSNITGSAVTMPNNVNFLPTARLNIRSSAINFSNHGIDGSTDILATIQNTGGQTARILYQNYNNQRFLIEQANLAAFDLRITIDNGALCEFNGVDWYISIQIDFEYWGSPPPRMDMFTRILAAQQK